MYKTAYDYDPTTTAAAVSGESHTVPASAPYQISLKYIPRNQSPSTVSISGFVETTATPAQGQFRVNYTTTDPEGNTVPGVSVDFDSADANTAVSVDYNACGTIPKASDFNDVFNTVNALENGLQGGGSARRSRLFAAAVRYDSTAGGWRLIYTTAGTHKPIAVSSVTSDDVAITVNLDQADWGANPAACTWLAVPDETLAKKGVFCGASFDSLGGLYFGTINLYRAPASDYVYYDGVAWQSTTGLFTPSWSTDHLSLVTASAAAKLGAGQFPSITPRQTPYQIALGSVGHNNVTAGHDDCDVWFYNAAGTAVTTPDTSMKFYITDPRSSLLVRPNTDFAAYEDVTSSNIWIIGLATSD